jgi:tetratricopeptide (TPR) repeat protein
VSGDRDAGAETIELDPALQKTILEKERALGGDHFAVLGLTPGASEEEVRDAYYALSRVFHPDRYFRKNLGPFRQKLERIFHRLTEANGVLSDSTRREAYLRANPKLRPVVPVVDPERAAERRSRMARHPYLAKTGRSRDILSQAQRLLDAGQAAAAVEALQDAARLDPRSPEIQKALAQAKGRLEQKRQDRVVGHAEKLEETGDVEGALKGYLEALRATPSAALHRPSPAASRRSTLGRTQRRRSRWPPPTPSTG